MNVSSRVPDHVSEVNGIDIWDEEVSKVRRRSEMGLKCLSGARGNETTSASLNEIEVSWKCLTFCKS